MDPGTHEGERKSLFNLLLNKQLESFASNRLWAYGLLSLPGFIIVKNAGSSGSAVIKQDEAARLIADKLGIAVSDVFSAGYLNIESAYEKVGWKVEYDKPGFNETYAATFTFTSKNREPRA